MIDKAIGEVFVQRVVNGWVVHRGRNAFRRHRDDEQYDDEAHVARSPKELADLIEAWASKQQEAANQHPPSNSIT